MSTPHEHPHAHTPDMHDPPDQWHRHTTAEERPQHAHGELASPYRVLAAGGIAFVFVIVSSVVVYLYYNNFTINKLRRTERTGFEGPVLAMRQDMFERMHRGYVWGDPVKGFVQLPLETARRRVIDQYARRTDNQSQETGSN